MYSNFLKLFYFVLVLSLMTTGSLKARMWVYLTPEEGQQLYGSSFFAELQAQADNYVAKGITNPINKISHNEMWVIEMGNAIEVASAVMFARKHGQYDGVYHPALDSYRTFLVTCWKRMIQEGPVNTMIIYGGRSDEWYESDISLRPWIAGAWASYDAIRDDLASADRTAIDTWIGDFANGLWTHKDATYMSIGTNRPHSLIAQCCIIALVLQNQPLFETYYNTQKFGQGNKNRSLKNIIDVFGYPLRAGCENGLPQDYGISDELQRSDGSHGVDAIKHVFLAMMHISHAARHGGSPTWDMLHSENQNQQNLQRMINYWYRMTFGDLHTQFVNYIHAVEDLSGYTAAAGGNYEPVKHLMKKHIGSAFAYLDSRFETADWGAFTALSPTYRDYYDGTKQKLYKLRAKMLRETITPTTRTEDFTTPSNWTMVESSSPQTTLSVANGRIHYLTTSTGEEGCGAQWNGPTLPVNRDWSISAEVHIDEFNLTSVGQFAGISFGVGRTGDLMNTRFLWEFGRGDWGSTKGYEIGYSLKVNGQDSPSMGEVPGLTSPEASLRLDYSAAMPSITFYLDADGATGGYSWTSQGVLQMGEFMDRLDLSDTDTFSVLVVGGSHGQSVSSGVVALHNMKVTTSGSTPPTEPSITRQPQSQSIVSGGTTQLRVTATGSIPRHYQWYIGSKGVTSNPISGAIESTYTTPALTTTTSYWVRVTNGAGSVDSEAATLSVTTDIFTTNNQTTHLGHGWYWNELFGYFHKSGSYLYIANHLEWVYWVGISEEHYYIYRYSTPEWGWCSSAYYPWYYSFGSARFKIWVE